MRPPWGSGGLDVCWHASAPLAFVVLVFCLVFAARLTDRLQSEISGCGPRASLCAQALDVGVAALITEPPMVLGWLGGCCARLCACAFVVVLLSVLGRIARESMAGSRLGVGTV